LDQTLPSEYISVHSPYKLISLPWLILLRLSIPSLARLDTSPGLYFY
jgi:hypothetical protein